MPMTTIKVPTELRDRINAEAKGSGLTAAALLSELLDEHDHARRFTAIKEAYGRLPDDDDYWSETRAWDELASRLPVEND